MKSKVKGLASDKVALTAYTIVEVGRTREHESNGMNSPLDQELTPITVNPLP
jgi:hypothetical protein